MTQTAYSRNEVMRRGKECYQQHIRAQAETEENIGKIISIDKGEEDEPSTLR